MNTKASIAEILQLSPVMPVVTIEDAASGRRPRARARARWHPASSKSPLRTSQAVARHRSHRRAGAGDLRRRRHRDDAGGSRMLARMRAPTFAISPGRDARVARSRGRLPHPYLPAVATASELDDRRSSRATRHFKLFPPTWRAASARSKDFYGPFPEARFCPTGGVLAADGRQLSGASQRPVRRRLVAHARRRCEGARLGPNIEALAREAAALRPTRAVARG